MTVDTYPKYPGFTLHTVEDFTTPMDLDNDPIFTWSDGSPADGQTRFRKANIVFADGKMMIKAESPCAAMTGNSKCIKAAEAGANSFAEPDLNKTQGLIGDMGVWSGEFRTKYNNYRYGRYEAKFKAPTANPGHETEANTAGGFLSTLFAFRSPKWSIWNEIDIELEGSIPTTLAGNVLNVAGRTGYPGDANNAFTTTQGLPAGYKNVDSHVYAFTWLPTSIDWYVDGVLAKTFKGGAATAGNVPIPTVSAKIMMNLWVFSGTPFGTGANNHYPMQAEYEYFRFYKADTVETVYPCSPAPACLPAADKSASAQNNPTEKNYGM